jgi:hypothetical protein
MWFEMIADLGCLAVVLQSLQSQVRPERSQLRDAYKRGCIASRAACSACLLGTLVCIGITGMNLPFVLNHVAVEWPIAKDTHAAPNPYFCVGY